MFSGSVYEQNGAIGLKIHLSGFGLSDESKSEFGDLDEVAWLSATEQTKDPLIERGPNYARNSEQLREARGALRADLDGFAMPTCVHCPDPPYADAARVAKVQGTVVLGVVITGEDKAGTIHVLKAAPFGLTAQAIKAVRNWEFKPAQQRDGTPVSMAVPIEVTYRMF